MRTETVRVTLPPDTIYDRGAAAWAAGAIGDFRAADDLVRAFVREPSPDVRAWMLALGAQRFHAEPGAGRMPEPREVADLSGTGPWARSAASLVCAEASRGRVLAFDAEGLARWNAVHRSLLQGGETHDALLWLEISESWLALLAGNTQAAADRAAAAAREASAQGLAPLLLEANALRALCLATAGDLDAATAAARRTSRMARTEALPQWEYLANVVLARVRRLTGRPHLAMRILTALGSVAPAPWWPWIEWELLMAAGTSAPLRPAASPAEEACAEPGRSATLELSRMLETAAGGDRATFESAARSLESLIGGVTPFGRDLAMVRLVVDPFLEGARSDARAASYLRGTGDRPPPEVRGLCTRGEGEASADIAAVWVIGVPGTAGRRVAAVGVPLLGDVPRIRSQRGRVGRVETLLSALALAGPDGLSVEEAFRVVYGFDFDRGVHGDLLKVLLHRARGAVGETGRVLREDGRLTLELDRVLLISDPRSEQSLEDLVLALLSPQGGGNARAVAKQLRVPLRTVQAAIQRLVEEGAVVVEQRGRRFDYRVEDTTFSEPTRV